MASVEMTTGRSLAGAFVLTLATLALAIVLSILISRTITQPIDRLIEGTEKIARGSFEEIRVSSRDETAHLAEAFNSMSKRLKALDQYKADMMHQISHELRSPLSAILGAHFFMASKRAGPVTDQQVKMLEIIHESVERLTKFSQQFLDLARAEAGMIEYALERTDIVPVVERIVRENEIEAERKNVVIVSETTPVPDVMIDAEKIAIVVGNLMSNAIKYTADNGRIRVGVSPCDYGVRLSVSDTGIGISQEDLPHVFTKFYKARNAGASGAAGTGVGLALVKAFTEGHGGRISVKSTLGTGTTFTVELPAAPSNGAPPTKTAAGETRRETT